MDEMGIPIFFGTLLIVWFVISLGESICERLDRIITLLEEAAIYEDDEEPSS